MQRRLLAAVALLLAPLSWGGPARADKAKDARPSVSTTHVALEFLRVHAVGEFQRGHLHVELGVVDFSCRIGIPGPVPLWARFRLANLHHDRHADGTTGATFTRFADRWATTEVLVELGRIRLGGGFVLVERLDWVIPAAVASKLWSHTGMSSAPYAQLEDEGLLFGLPRAAAVLDLGPLELSALYETRGWSPLGFRLSGRALLRWRGVSLDLAGGYASRGGTLRQYGGDPGQPDHAGGISWTSRTADLSVVLGVDFWAPFRHLTRRFPGTVTLQLGTRARHVVEHTLADSRGKIFFEEAPGTDWGFWIGLAVGVLQGGGSR